ncbi:MAG: efflux RND transporter periplasmic adaptor subunit [Candidatus Omnitrophica bacterium]|nr:efflux RND transporter periplasmic adaptor subunit [Candidatus Omnitrophota bacterium]
MKIKEFWTRNNIIILAAILIAVFVMARGIGKVKTALEKYKAKKAPVGEELQEIVPVKVFRVKRVPVFKDVLPILGNVEGYKEIDLKFESAGVIQAINFREGERVAEGEVIANIDSRDALLKMKYNEIEMDKVAKLYGLGAVLEAKYEQARLEYESAKSAFDKTSLVAQVDGVLAKREAEEGEYVSPNDKVGTLVDMDSVFCRFGIIEKDVRKVRLGQKTDIMIDAYPKDFFPGLIGEISPMIEGRSRTFSIKVKLDNPDDKLKPGMFARGGVVVYEKNDVLVIPSMAMKKKEDTFSVYIIHEEEKEDAAEDESKKDEVDELFGLMSMRLGTIEMRQIQPVYVTPDLVEVGEGIKEGELIAVELYQELADGSKVEIQEEVE